MVQIWVALLVRCLYDILDIVGISLVCSISVVCLLGKAYPLVPARFP